EGLAIVLSTHDLNGMAAHLPRLLCLNVRVAAEGTPREVLTSAVLEEVYGAPMEVLEHAGMPLVVDSPDAMRAAAAGRGADIRELRRQA
ncbi:MAG: hypothetical protein JO054_11535, partial [Actinobacteria bacterium]|nr:hypothetical protein [Actinomycetota bacterium]